MLCIVEIPHFWCVNQSEAHVYEHSPSFHSIFQLFVESEERKKERKEKKMMPLIETESIIINMACGASECGFEWNEVEVPHFASLKLSRGRNAIHSNQYVII